MIGYIGLRMVQAAAVMTAVAFIAFLMFGFVGDPVENMIGQEATVADREAMREHLGLNDPIVVQFARFVGGVLQGEFGVSYRLQRPVADLISERLPATLELVAVSAILAIVVGVSLGILTAVNRRSLFSRTALALSLIGVSLPTFVVGIALIYVFAVVLGALPSFGRGEVVELGWWTTGLATMSGLKALVLPAVTLALFQITLITRLVRTEMLTVLRTNYISFARARGLPRRSIYLRHALRNTLVPVITIIGLNIGQLIAFSIVTETVFQWPGMGALFIQSVSYADIPVMATYLVVVALVFVSINLLADALCAIADPRLRSQPAPRSEWRR